jgi:hypothetical protein
MVWLTRLRFHNDCPKAAVFLYNVLMSKELTVVLPDEMYRRLEQRAATTGQDVAGVLIEVINRDQILFAEESTYEPDNDAVRDPYRFAGMWADMTEEENKLFDEIIASHRSRFIGS